MKRFMLAIASIVLGVCMAAQSAVAGKKDDTLYISWDQVLNSYDVYFNLSRREGIMFGRLVWDNLVDRDPTTGEYKPLLATSWKWVDDKTIDFSLRQGVKFHNGQDFTADDVVFTLNWIADDKNKITVPFMVFWIDKAEKLDTYTVRLRMKTPFPAVFEYLAAAISIYPHEYYAKVGPQGMSDKPIGTGPYKVLESKTGESFTLVKNDNYFTGGPKGTPTIGKIVQRTIGDQQTQIAEFLSGKLDWIWRVPPDVAEKLKGRAGITVQETDTMRISFIIFDAAGKTGDHPMRNLKVRQAVAHSINRPDIAQHLLRGPTKVLAAHCYVTQFGCYQGVPQYEYNPAKARQLLAEAGYPKGFKIDFYAYRDRKVVEALLSDFKAVGIDADLKWLTFPALFKAMSENKIAFVNSTTGSYSINDASVVMAIRFDGGEQDLAMDQDVIKWNNEAGTITDPERRKELYKQALTRIGTNLYSLPLFTDYTIYAHTSDMTFTPDPDELGRFYASRWK